MLGSTVSAFAMDLAIKKAEEFGIGWVTCKGEFVFQLVRFMAVLCRIEPLFNRGSLGDDGRRAGNAWDGFYQYFSYGDTNSWC